jgi:transcriptional regulator GlxA family with amidase domain
VHHVRVTTSPPPAVEVLFFDGFEELDAVGPWEVLAAAGFPVRAVGFPEGLEVARGTYGLRVGVEGPLDPAPALVIVPGGGWLDGADRGARQLAAAGALPALLARLHAAGTVLASVCTGGMLLASAGLLAGRPAITNPSALDQLRASGADVRAGFRVVDDGEIVTSAGPTAGIDLGLHLVERYQGAAAARAASASLDYEPRGRVLVTTAGLG